MDGKRVVLIIRDGWGVSDAKEGNAVFAAKTPVYDLLKEECAHSLLGASGEDVGLPSGMMGNSEVGHLNLGAGRVVNEVITRINKDIESGDFFSNPALMKAIENCKENNSSLHIMGLVEDAGVHSHIAHIFALLKLAHDNGVSDKVKLHLWSDGKDSPQRSFNQFYSQIKEVMDEFGVGKVCTLIGKDSPMDRSGDWEQVKEAYDCIVFGRGRKAESVEHAVHTAYENGENDYDLKPTVIGEYSGIDAKDSVIFFNYRLDCGREITKAFVDRDFSGFARSKLDILFVCFAEYYHELENIDNAFIGWYPEMMPNILGEVIAKNNLKQLRVAESEKYAHVTYFFNGEFETPFAHEDRIIVNSPDVDDFSHCPESSSEEVASKVVLKMKDYDLVIVNLASADLTGHTGDFDATVKAVEVVDSCIGSILKKAKELDYVVVITADHGNCESMLLEGEKKPSHSTNPVDLIVYNYNCNLKDGRLADVAPTVLDILGLEKPSEMTGESLI
jgi:2,3-bisphosphoglycerate-independent phosphoglycerate mutase